MNDDMSTLMEEHALLGAMLADEDEVPAVASYGNPSAEREAILSSCGVCDLSGTLMALVSGEGVGAFASAALAAMPLAVGECGHAAVLSGDGALVAVPMALRTGAHELLVIDPSRRADALFWWLGWLSSVEQGGVRPFGGIVVEERTGDLVPLLVAGPESAAVLGDYLSLDETLPEPGQVSYLHLDKIETIVAGISDLPVPGWLLLVPPQLARVLWRSLMSFGQVSPVGGEALSSTLLAALPWQDALSGPDRVEVPAHDLVSWNIARIEGGYVGARALGA